jgi:guanylate kinase
LCAASRKINGRRYAPPANSSVKNWKVKSWCIFLSPLELTLSKIPKKIQSLRPAAVPPSGTVVVILGPSGVGKDAIINIIASRSSFTRFPTCTTRKPRPGEINGVHYHFVDEETFTTLWQRGDLLDHVIITNYHYGLPIEKLGMSLENGQDIIVHLAPGSAFLLKRIILDAILLFIMPPAQEEIIKRMHDKGMREEQIANRLRDDSTTIRSSLPYDFIVVNHDGEEQETAERILAFVSQRRGAERGFDLQKKLADTVECHICILNFSQPKMKTSSAR